MKQVKATKAKNDPRRDGFASATEAANFLSVSQGMITKLTKAGEIPYKRFGQRALRIPWNWLLDQVDSAK